MKAIATQTVSINLLKWTYIIRNAIPNASNTVIKQAQNIAVKYIEHTNRHCTIVQATKVCNQIGYNITSKLQYQFPMQSNGAKKA